MLGVSGHGRGSRASIRAIGKNACRCSAQLRGNAASVKQPNFRQKLESTITGGKKSCGGAPGWPAAHAELARHRLRPDNGAQRPKRVRPAPPAIARGLAAPRRRKARLWALQHAGGCRAMFGRRLQRQATRAGRRAGTRRNMTFGNTCGSMAQIRGHRQAAGQVLGGAQPPSTSCMIVAGPSMSVSAHT